MPLCSTRDLLVTARRAGYGLPAFNVVGLEHAEAIVRGAETARGPVMLQISENAVRFHDGAIEPIGRACAALAERARVPVALHLDHATTIALCERAAVCGFSSVMLDTADLPYDENVTRTSALARWAHARDIAVEAGVGVVGGKDGVLSTEDGMTDPDQARSFVADTGADALAVAVGTSHGMSERTAAIDLSRLARIRELVPVPLVLHGSSGLPDEALAAAVRHGITKVNLFTQLNVAFTAALRRALAADPEVVDPRRYLSAARAAVAETVTDRLRLLGAGGRA